MDSKLPTPYPQLAHRLHNRGSYPPCPQGRLRLLPILYLFMLATVHDKFLASWSWRRAHCSAPEFRGVKLYQIHEVVAVLAILIWESCIQIGLIPSNTDYEGLFQLADLDAVILDNAGNAVYRSEREPAEAGLQTKEKLLHSAPVRGGEIRYMEDVTEIRRMNREIAETTEFLKELPV